ncbi:beta-lactamase family protein [Maribacter sp. MMG018]|uniref:serine hydrolase domain-containing protein n=1 Tax=Maribacter sp. MMG018 TaxID=2822688 RepID=UPI001B39B96D|nr:serine hydrolase domain-containing protein [Maribacter sp. MMG018]MBQ4915612.1 beta-lactamase family protein [Maribacter sp. MMG018]
MNLSILSFNKYSANRLSAALLLALTIWASSCSKNDDGDPPASNYTTIENLLTEIDFQGYAIITKNGSDLVRLGFGSANQNSNLPQGYNLAYRIGSVTKTLTAAAIVQLKRDGLINGFDQTLDEFDPEFPNGDQITIAHLLSHQSGIPEYQSVVEQAFEEGLALDEVDIYEVITDLVSENGLHFTPGSNKQYCNSNYLIAALLVQQLSGVPYHQYVQQNIFGPLGMADSFKGTDEIDVDTHAQGYLNGNVNSTYPMGIAFGAGDFSSSPKDMETWTNAVKTNWFTEAEKAEIFAQEVPSGFVDFGLGWFTTQEGNTTMYWHGGDINGYWSMIGFVPQYDATLVLLSNQQDDSGSQRNTIIQQLLTHEFIQ